MKQMDRKGMLPYAAAAVVLLLIVSAWGAAAYSLKEGDSAADDVSDSIGAVEKAEGSV